VRRVAQRQKDFLLCIVLVALAGVIILAVGFAAQAPPDAENGTKKEGEFTTDLSVLKDAGPKADGTHKALCLHVLEENVDTLQDSWFPDVEPQGVFFFQKGKSRLLVRTPAGQRIEEGVIANGVVQEEVRFLVTHRVVFPVGARDRYYMEERVYVVGKLPFRVDLAKDKELGRLGTRGQTPKIGETRLVGVLEVLSVQPDGTVEVKYDGEKVTLPVGGIWPAPARSRAISRSDFTKAFDEPPENLDDCLQSAQSVRFTTSVDVTNRSIATVQTTTKDFDEEPPEVGWVIQKWLTAMLIQHGDY